MLLQIFLCLQKELEAVSHLVELQAPMNLWNHNLQEAWEERTFTYKFLNSFFLCRYAGNAVSCAAASATIDVIKEEKLLHNVNERGLFL